MRLAKEHLDVGLFTANLDPMLAFWQHEAGLPLEEILPLGGGAHQYRHAMNGSVLKINTGREPLPAAPPAGYRELVVARPGLAAPRLLADPDGNRVVLVPPGEGGVLGILVRLAVRDEAAFRRFYRDQCGFEEAGSSTYRCGDSLIEVRQDPAVRRVEEMRGPGYRYLTVQVRDVDAEHFVLLATGAEEGRPPVTLGKVARISFIRDPDGNWIEVSQRASLTGPLPA